MNSNSQTERGNEMSNPLERKVIGSELKETRFYLPGSDLPEYAAFAKPSCGHSVRVLDETNLPATLVCKECRKNAAARCRCQIYGDLGRRRVRGGLGGVYCESQNSNGGIHHDKPRAIPRSVRESGGWAEPWELSRNFRGLHSNRHSAIRDQATRDGLPGESSLPRARPV